MQSPTSVRLWVPKNELTRGWNMDKGEFIGVGEASLPPSCIDAIVDVAAPGLSMVNVNDPSYLSNLAGSYILVKILSNFNSSHYSTDRAGYIRPEQHHSQYPRGLVLADGEPYKLADGISISDEGRASVNGAADTTWLKTWLKQWVPFIVVPSHLKVRFDNFDQTLEGFMKRAQWVYSHAALQPSGLKPLREGRLLFYQVITQKPEKAPFSPNEPSGKP